MFFKNIKLSQNTWNMDEDNCFFMMYSITPWAYHGGCPKYYIIMNLIITA